MPLSLLKVAPVSLDGFRPDTPQARLPLALAVACSLLGGRHRFGSSSELVAFPQSAPANEAGGTCRDLDTAQQAIDAVAAELGVAAIPASDVYVASA
jgi:hypothetical protein